MAIETFGFIDDLNAANPTATDNVSEGDDHLRGLKTTLKNTFPNVTGAITATETELNYVDGVTSNIQTQLANINTDLVNDTTPQLGGSLDLNGNAITGTGAIPSANLTGALPAISGAALTGVQPFPSGTKMVFAQAAAPTGWTQDTTNNDKALRVVSGAGGGTGGTHAFSSPPSTAHTHTGPSHTHSTPSHSHTHTLSAGAHTLSTAEMPSHNHSINIASGNYHSSYTSHVTTSRLYSYNTSLSVNNSGGGGSHSHTLAGSITSGGSGTSGAGGTGATSSAGPTAFAPQYVDVIVCSKD
jgi:hypothetical protein